MIVGRSEGLRGRGRSRELGAEETTAPSYDRGSREPEKCLITDA
jgi:hypothetical protein